MRKLFVLLFFCCGWMHLWAQKNTVSKSNAELIGSFPFTQFLGGVIMVHAYFDTISIPLNFILDTGSGGISLDSTTCVEFNIENRKTDTTLAGIGGVKKVHFAFNKSLRINNVVMDSLNFHVNDYEPFIRVYGSKIDGVIGYSMFSRFIVKINYDTKQIELYSPGAFRYPRGGMLLQPVFTKLVVQEAEITDKAKIKFPFYFDTGAGLPLLLSEEFAAAHNVLKDRRTPVVTAVNGVIGRTNTRLTVIKKIKFGRYIFKNVPTYLYNDVHNVMGYPKTGGLLGSDLFRRFNLVLNYPQHEIHLVPNTHFEDEFDYGYTGLNIYFDGSRILVDEIIVESPSYNAGFKIDDEVVSVGKNVSQNIESYRADLQLPNKTYLVIIRRGGKLLTVTLTTESIL